MINRILIRIKVVQMLYSYLLVEKDFSLESQPSAPTKEKRFAYSLYLDLLTLMVQLSDTVERRGQGTPLAESRFIKGVKNDDRMRSLLARYRAEGFPFASVASSLAEKESYRELIDEFIDKRVWDTERIALMDMVILYTAMAELLHFEKIPAQVTVNEYIEMARAYSAPKSAQFVHGILGVIINRLNEEGRIRK